MRFGLHFLVSCSDEQSPQQRYRETLQQAVVGEALGFDSIWPVEHHFDRDVSSLSAPTLLLAAIAQCTNKIRLGTGVIQVPLGQPLRIAEELATLDVLSNGRAELGVGRGSNHAHAAGFGIDLADSRARFEEGMQLLERALSGQRFSFEGRFFRAEQALLTPRPVQPRLPIRVGCNTLDTARWAGEHGYPILVASHMHPLGKLPALLDIYRSARIAAGLDAATPADISLLMPLFVGESLREVEDTIGPNFQHWKRLSTRVAASALGNDPTAEQRAFIQSVTARMESLTFAQMSDGMACLGSPADCHAVLHQVRALEIGRVIAWFNFGGLLSHHHVLRSMERFSREVMPSYEP